MSKILLVDDEINIREVIREYAALYGHEVKEACDGEQAISFVENEDFDVIIMDIMMPNLDGYSASKQIKALKDIPIIMLSARQEEYDKLYSFEIGVDDYVTKPFSPKELMARIKVVVDRHHNFKTNILSCKGISVDVLSYKVFIDNNEIHLTPKEFELLVYFLQNRNIAITRDQLLSVVWKYDYFGDDRTVDTHVKMLRKSLGIYRDYIITIRGIGYKFEAD